MKQKQKQTQTVKVTVNLAEKRRKGRRRRRIVQREVRVGDPIGVPHRFLSGDASGAARGFNLYQDLARVENERLSRRDMAMEQRARDLDIQRRDNEAMQRATRQIVDNLARTSEGIDRRFNMLPQNVPLTAPTFQAPPLRTDTSSVRIARRRVAPPDMPSLYRLSSASDSDSDIFGENSRLSTARISGYARRPKTPSPPPQTPGALNISGTSSVINPTPLSTTSIDRQIQSTQRFMDQANRDFERLTRQPATGLYEATPMATPARSLFRSPQLSPIPSPSTSPVMRGGAARGGGLDFEAMSSRLIMEAGPRLSQPQSMALARIRGGDMDNLRREDQNYVRLLYNHIFGRGN